MPTIRLDYQARPQFVPFHSRRQRWAAIVAHRRAGKTVACIMDIVDAALRLERPHGRYAYVAPFLSQAKEVSWDYLKRFAQPVLAEKNEAELWVELVNGSRIRIHGADNPDRLRGAYLDGVILDEYADMRPSVWGEVIRPMLADRQGWAVFIGTPKGKNEFWKVWARAQANPADWHAEMLRASETRILDEDELIDAARDMTPEQYAQEFECSFDAAILGAYYAPELGQADRDGRISVADYDPAIPVHTAWDLGIGDSTAIWLWQAAPDGLKIIDFIESSGKALSHYVSELNSRPYKYGTDFLPHDAQARELQTGKTRVEALIGLGRKPAIVVAHTVQDGINALRMTIPKAWFDASRCAEGIEALRQYRADYDEKLKTFRNTPKHDWTSHAADAARYMALAYRGLVPQTVVKEQPPKELQYKIDEQGRLRSNMSVRQIVEAKMRKKRLA